MAELQIRKISKSYQKNEGYVLQSVDLTIKSGEIFFLLGPSGCGKSTLLRMIAGLIEPTSGTILLDGRDITHLPPEKRNTPMVFQSYALWPHLDVYENIAFGLKQLRLPAAEIRQRVENILETVHLESYIHRKITSLSGGQQQRVALARALALNPSVILLDEPLSNLDAKLRDDMRLEIRRICKERALTAIYVTHDRKEALSMADRLAVLHQGIVQQIGTPRELYMNPVNRFTASFLGDANMLDGELVRDDEKSWFFQTQIGEIAVRKINKSGHEESYQKAQKYSLMFRPENVLFEDNCSREYPENHIRAEILENSYWGESSFRTMQAGSFRFYANEFAAPERSAGALEKIILPADRIIPLSC